VIVPIGFLEVAAAALAVAKQIHEADARRRRNPATLICYLECFAAELQCLWTVADERLDIRALLVASIARFGIIAGKLEAEYLERLGGLALALPREPQALHAVGDRTESVVARPQGQRCRALRQFLSFRAVVGGQIEIRDSKQGVGALYGVTAVIESKLFAALDDVAESDRATYLRHLGEQVGREIVRRNGSREHALGTLARR
jgi:hypothetical protein